MDENNKPPVKATTTSTRILEALIDLGEGSLTNIKNEVDLSKSSVHNHLETLEYLGFVVKENQRYRPSLRFLEIGSSVRSRSPFYEPGREEVDRLAQTSGLAAGLVALERDQGICLYSRVGQKVQKTHVEGGETVPLHCTASGKAILAELPEEKRTSILESRGLEPFTEQTITSRSELADQIRTVQTRELASNREEWRTDLRGLASGITDPDTGSIGAIYVLSPSESMSGKRFQQDVPGLVISSANRIRKVLQTSRSIWSE